MFNRRAFLIAAGALSAAPGTAGAQGSKPTTADILKCWNFAPATPLSGTATTEPTGLSPARNEEVATAFPLEGREIFRGHHRKKCQRNPYTWEWPTPGRANPMIVGFFSMTNTFAERR
jgi:hypothetical protein